MSRIADFIVIKTAAQNRLASIIPTTIQRVILRARMLSLEELAGQPLELFAREGAKLLLTVALEEEVTDILKRRPYESSSLTTAATAMATGSVM